MESALLDKDIYGPDDLLTIPDAHRFDLVDGMLVEKDMGSLSSWVGGELYACLRDYARANRWGWVWHADAGFNCFPGGTVRYPDVAALRFGRLTGEVLPEGHIEIVPDFVAEVVSPRDRIEELEEKLREYRRAGVGLVWVIYPTQRIARIHRRDRTITEVGETETLSGEGVLPGFSVRVGELFPVRPARPAPPPPAPSEPEA